MVKPDFLKKLATQITEALPKQVSACAKDFEKNCQHILGTALNKLDLVSRHDFDVQSKVLARARKQLEELEEKVKHLEKALKDKKH